MKNTTRSYLLILLLLIFCAARFLFVDALLSATRTQIVVIIFWILLCLLTLLMLRYPKDNSINNKMSIKVVLISIISAFIIEFLLGFFIGFIRNSYSLNIFNIFKNVFGVLLVYIPTEIIRYVFAKNSIYNKKPIILYTMCLILIDILFALPSFYNVEVIFRFVCTVVFPSIATQLLCSYLSYNFSIYSALIYIIFINVYIYFVPILPNLGDFIKSVILILVPFLIYLYSGRIVKYNNKEKENQFNFKLRLLIFTPVLVFLVTLVVLITGIFNYKLIAVASNSMNPVFSRGDAVIYKKTKDIKLYDVIAFQRSGKVVTHRVVAIKRSNGELYITTKGDNNNTADEFVVHKKDVLGVVVSTIDKIGYPTVWFNEELKGE